jgi:hypothetical protein
LIYSPCVLQPEGHSFVSVCPKQGDEHCLDLVLFLEGDLMVGRVAVKEREQDVASRRVDNFVDAWERERIFRAMSIEIGIIHAHPPFMIILFQKKYRIT